MREEFNHSKSIYIKIYILNYLLISNCKYKYILIYMFMYVMHAPVSTTADFKTIGFALSVKMCKKKHAKIRKMN